MKALFEEYGDMLISLITGIIIITTFLFIFFIEVFHININILSEHTMETIPNIHAEPIGIKSFKVKDILVKQGEEINYLDRVEATNNRGNFDGIDEDISSFVSIYNTVDTNVIGEHDIEYVLRYNGESKFVKAKVIVAPNEEFV